MAIQLRVSLPDRPGALALVAAAIADAGADVVSVAVMEAEAGRAIDDFRLRWPDARDASPLLDALTRYDGVTVLGCRRT
ncbi:MAG TPA: ACT domain-containing protein, partial [Mycobacteriales bacterium]|nr:ACT domain-containing protein [Mycobacteriales bacterium]